MFLANLHHGSGRVGIIKSFHIGYTYGSIEKAYYISVCKLVYEEL